MDPDTAMWPVAADNSLTPSIRLLNHTTAHTIAAKSRVSPGGISGFRVLRRSPRSVSSHTASDIQEESHKRPPKRRQRKRRSIARQEVDLPLSEDPIQTSKRARRRKPGPTVRTQIAAAHEENAPFLKTPRRPHVTALVDSSALADRVRAHLLLDLARHSVQRETDWFGRKPCVMDIILDLKDLAQSSAEALMLLRGSRYYEDLHPDYYRTYDFCDERSVADYWADRTAIWSGMPLNDNTSNAMGFPVSNERSTARWSSALNCGG